MQDSEEIDRILARGAERGRALAGPILQKTYDIVGMIR
jgi:tryptophanyl-tRNA synthetase